MRERFREYHKFTNNGFQDLWKESLFVFDTNTLLDMYRYRRETVEEYLKVMGNLKKKDQIWIPYQVGLEFYENRLGVISEYEESYDTILSVLDKAKADIEGKYKNHPFLDFSEIRSEMTNALSSIERKIKLAKKNHPKLLEKHDDILEQLNNLFDESTGEKYTTEKLAEIYKDGEKRYEEKIPPGYKDSKKGGARQYGDLVLWNQIIDKAVQEKKPIILISGDVKEDWWLEHNGKRIQPRPELKREMLEKADVDFHIYTADKFLELYRESTLGVVGEDTINEVRKIREIEESKSLSVQERSASSRLNFFYFGEGRNLISTALDSVYDIDTIISNYPVHPYLKEELTKLFSELASINERISAKDGRVSRYVYEKATSLIKECLYLLDKFETESYLSRSSREDIVQARKRLESILNEFRHGKY